MQYVSIVDDSCKQYVFTAWTHFTLQMLLLHFSQKVISNEFAPSYHKYATKRQAVISYYYFVFTACTHFSIKVYIAIV